MQKIIEACSTLLNDYPIAEQAKNYLDQRLDKETQRLFNFGFFPDYNNTEILFQLADKDILLKYGIIYEKLIYDGSINKKAICGLLENHNLILPYKNTYGDIIALVGRSLQTDQEREVSGISKYKNSSFEKSKYLFGLYEAKKSIIEKGYVYIVEGQFDCIQGHSKGLNNIVALGSSNMSLEQFALILRYTKDIRLLMDNDIAGESGREKIIQKFGKYTEISNKYVPRGFKDIDEYLKENRELSIEEIEEALE